MEISKRTLHHINTLKELYDFDLESGIATVPLHYASPDDLVDEHLSRPGKPVITDEAVDYLVGIIRSIPKEFSVDFSLQFDECEDYSPSSLLTAIRTAIDNRFFYHDANRKKDNINAVFFILLGILLLAYEYIAMHFGWLGSEEAISTGFLEALIDITSWIFIWEGGAILFLTYGEDSTLFRKDIRRLHGICAVNKTGELVCKQIESDQVHNWVNPRAGEKFARNYILFFFPLLFIFAVVLIAELVDNAINLSTFEMIPYIVVDVLIVFLIICNISFYKESGAMKKFAIPLSFVIAAFMLFDIFSWSWGETFDLYFFTLDCVIFVLVLIEIICLLYMRKQNVIISQKKE